MTSKLPIVLSTLQAQFPTLFNTVEQTAIKQKNIEDLRTSLLGRLEHCDLNFEIGKNLYSTLIVLCRYFPLNEDEVIASENELLLSTGRRVNIYKKEPGEQMLAPDYKYEEQLKPIVYGNRIKKAFGVFMGAALGTCIFIFLPDMDSQIALFAILFASMMLFACIGYKIATCFTKTAPFDPKAAEIIGIIDKETTTPKSPRCCSCLLNWLHKPKSPADLEFDDYRPRAPSS